MRPMLAKNQTAPAPDAECAVRDGDLIQFHLEVRFPDGYLALSTFEEEPILCRLGDGTLTTALEACLKDLREGEERLLVASGSRLFGPYEESNRHWIDRDDFPDGVEPAMGRVVGFDTPAGQETSGIILDLDGSRALVDFNHPFSGRDLSLRIQRLPIGD